MMKARVVREVHETKADVFLRDEDGNSIAIFSKQYGELADKVAAFLNAPDLRGLLIAEHEHLLESQRDSCAWRGADAFDEHITAVKDERFHVHLGCEVCVVLGADEGS